MKILQFVVLAISLGITGPAAVSEANSERGGFEFGTWSAPCDAWGVPATCSSAWRPGLGANHVIQDYSIVSRADQSPIFAGRGLYQLNGAQVAGVWEDSRGTILELSGSYEDNALEIIWIDPQTEIGRSTYDWESGQLNVSDSVLTDNGWREFMAVTYPASQSSRDDKN